MCERSCVSALTTFPQPRVTSALALHNRNASSSRRQRSRADAARGSDLGQRQRSAARKFFDIKILPASACASRFYFRLSHNSMIPIDQGEGGLGLPRKGEFLFREFYAASISQIFFAAVRRPLSVYLSVSRPSQEFSLPRSPKEFVPIDYDLAAR